MVDNNKKFAFSLAEAVTSMIILGIVGACALPVITKMTKSEGLNEETVMGAYACYYDASGNLKQVYYEGRNQKTDYPAVANGVCTFKENKRAGKIYIIAVGAGSANVSGQIKTDYTAELQGDITIKPGKTGNNLENGTTTYTISDSPVSAAPGFDEYASSKVMPGNIKKCKYVSGNCPNPSSGSCLETSRAITGCEALTYQDEGSNVEFYALKLSGCGCTNESGNQYSENYTYKGKTIKKALDIIPVKDISRTTPKLRDRSKAFIITNYKYNDIIFNLDLYDALYDGEENDADGKDLPHLRDYLTNTSALRQTKLTQDMINLDPGAKGKSGAVVILW